MTLIWRGYSAAAEGLIAVGRRGTYQIRWVAGPFLLTGIDHSDLPMSGLPPWGRHFASAGEAQTHAASLELALAESEASGA